MTAASSFPFSTTDLIQVVPTLKRAQKFLLDTFFTNIKMSDTEYVAIDIDVGLRRMSPFVSPLVQGKLVEQRRYQTNIYKPPYIKDKRAPDLRKPVMRQIGERIGGGELSGAEREMANINFEMADQIDMLDRRLEWMAAQALSTGKVTVSGEGFPTEIIDFGRDSSLTVALTGNNRWGVAANFDADGRDPVPAANIEVWQHQILKLSGAQVTDIVFTTTPWQYFLNAKGVQGAIYYPKLGQGGNAIDPGAQIAPGAVYKGRWGQYNLWVYNDWYIDENGVEQPMLVDGTVLMSGPQLLGTRAFGQILDPNFNYAALPYAPKTWVENDPAQRILLMQSSPLVIPSRVNASFSANVCAPQVA
ncbi:major capsid protein [Dyella lutea]|uniref:Major capsid protein n=1 Tax=Dyella lutea TaxID=2950441 RepID=A0ABT1FFW8_9GAMM|nr:major capsid protein [Dyella lutea]MCP1376040.1 major capsid protein [Dyella lutea]